MTKTEQLAAAAANLSDDQKDALISLAHSMADRPFLESAPPEAIASLERGLEQLEKNQTVPFDEAMKRLRKAAITLRS